MVRGVFRGVKMVLNSCYRPGPGGRNLLDRHNLTSNVRTTSVFLFAARVSEAQASV